MSFRRTFIWTCDCCFADEPKETYKIPVDWTWGDNPVTHFCHMCSAPYEVLENQKRGKLKVQE